MSEQQNDIEPAITADGSVSIWLDELKVGNEDAVAVIWDRYFATLVAVAKRNLRQSLSRAADEEDVALSAFHSFIRGIDRGRFAKLDDRNDLWRLLLVITLRKAADQTTHETRLKRGGGKVRGETEISNAHRIRFSLDQLVSGEPTPEVDNMIREQISHLMAKLGDPTLEKIAIAKMEGFTDEEIAVQLKCVRRTVVRKLAVVRQLWTEGVEL